MFTEGTMANVTIFAGNFAPLGYQLCQGQLISIAANNALFALIGTTYGGDGQNTFALPDLRSRIAIHAGQGPGFQNYTIGQIGGNESTTMISTQMPQHTHPLATLTGSPGASSVAGTTDIAVNNLPAPVNGSGSAYSTAPSAATMGAAVVNATTGVAGGNQPIDILRPVLAMNYIICVEGIFPSRN